MADPNLPENELKNTIDIQLRLIDSSEITTLEKVFDQFKTSVNTFQSVLGTVAQQLAVATAQMGGDSMLGSAYAIGNASHQSTAKPSQMKSLSVQQQREDADANQARLSTMRDKLQGSAKSASYEFQKDISLGNLLLAGEFRNWGPRQVAQAGIGALATAYWGGEKPISQGGQGPARPHLALPMAVASGYLAGNTMANVLGAGTGSAFGTGVGYSRGSVPLFGSANIDYLKQMWGAGTSSWFGLNPAYSYGQSMEARNIINQFGYAGSTSGQFANALQNVTSAVPAIPQQVSGQVMDAGYRYGVASLGQVQSELMNLSRAAQAAQMNVGPFAEQVLGIAQGLAQSQGIPQYLAFRQVAQASAGTGFAPNIAAQPLETGLYTNITAARFGGDFFKATFSPYRAGYTMQEVQQQIQNIGGGRSWGQLRQMLASGRGEQFKNALALLYQSPGGRQLLGNMNPQQVITMIMRGVEPGKLTMAASGIDQGLQGRFTHGTGPSYIGNIMANLGMTHAQEATFLHNTAGESYQQRLQQLQGRLKQEQQRATTAQHSNRMQLALTPDAAKLVKLLAPDQPQTRNTQNPGGNYAVQGGGTVMGVPK